MNRYKFRPIETFLSGYLATYGLTFLAPAQTFSNPAYNTMKNIASEEYWGVLFVLVALIQLAGMLKNNKNMKLIGLSLSIFLWSSVGTMFILGSISTGVLVTGVNYIWLALLSLFLIAKIGEQNE